MSNPFPTVTVENKLKNPFIIYDSFRNATGTPGADDLFGTLTPLATLQPGTSQPVVPLHGPISSYLAYAIDGTPIAHEFTMGKVPVTFTIDNQDANRISATQRFYDFVTANPKDPLATSFAALLTDPHAPAKVDEFFKGHPPYKDCTFVSYMMVVAAKARTPGQPVQSASYNLSTLCNSLGGTWPAGFPDIRVTNFSCATVNDSLVISGDVELQSLPFDPISAPFIRSMLPPSTVHATFRFHYGFDLGALGTRIEVELPKMTLPPGVNVQKATLSLDINPLFKFVVFGAKATIPFSLFGNPPFDALLTLTVDNLEAAIGIVIDGNHASLLTPPMMKGVHFDQFGVGMGLFFEPPAYALGVQGKFHIGDGTGAVALTDDTFVVVCKLEGDVPDPVYISFYVPKMELSDLITIFTNSSINIGLPVSVTDLSFRWAEKPMEPVALPDGTLSKMGYGFSGNLNVLGLSFYGDIEIDMNGLHGSAMTAPLSLGPLHLSGNGPGVTIKVDANGNPVHNNQVATTKAMRDAIAKATPKQLVAPGGPSLAVNASSPYLSLGAKVSIFDVVSESVSATVGSDGFKWEQDLGTVVQSKMRCTLAGLSTFTGEFAYGIDMSVPLPSIAGFSLGSIPLKAMIDATIGIRTSGTDVEIQAGAGFDFEGLTISIGPLAVDVHTGKLGDVISMIGRYILDHAGDLFAGIIGDAGKWASLAFRGLITGIGNVAGGLRAVYGKTAEEVASIMRGAGYGLDAAASAIRGAFSTSAQDTAKALSDAYGATAQSVLSALKGAGYAAAEIGQALSGVYAATAQDVIAALKGAGYAVTEITQALSGAYGATAQDAAAALKGAGFAVTEVSRGLSDVYGGSTQKVVAALKGAGFAITEISQALSSVYGATAQDVAADLSAAGYAITDISQVLSGVYNMAAGDISTTLQNIGYAAGDVENAFNSLGGSFSGYAQQTWEGIKSVVTGSC